MDIDIDNPAHQTAAFLALAWFVDEDGMAALLHAVQTYGADNVIGGFMCGWARSLPEQLPLHKVEQLLTAAARCIESQL